MKLFLHGPVPSASLSIMIPCQSIIATAVSLKILSMTEILSHIRVDRFVEGKGEHTVHIHVPSDAIRASVNPVSMKVL
jgi:hypothetical protein